MNMYFLKISKQRGVCSFTFKVQEEVNVHACVDLCVEVRREGEKGQGTQREVQGEKLTLSSSSDQSV